MSDQYRQAEGSLLPLWKFYTERCKHKHVTSLCWNPQYHDLFAVGYGSFDFLHQSSGLVCCYSMKNPSYPEYVFGTDSGKGCGWVCLPCTPVMHTRPGVIELRFSQLRWYRLCPHVIHSCCWFSMMTQSNTLQSHVCMAAILPEDSVQP